MGGLETCRGMSEYRGLKRSLPRLARRVVRRPHTWLFCALAACSPTSRSRLPTEPVASATSLANAPGRASPTAGVASSSEPQAGPQDTDPRVSGDQAGAAANVTASGSTEPASSSDSPRESALERAQRDSARRASSLEVCVSTNLVGCAEAFPRHVDCPRRFVDVPVGELCGLEGRTRAPSECAYPEGSCTCRTVPYCGGVTPSYLQRAGMRWSCVPPRKPTDCPARVGEGARCSVEGQRCATSGCGNETECVCSAAKLHCVTRITPTPPRAPVETRLR